MSKKHILPGALLFAFIALAIVGASAVRAQDSSNYPPIVKKLAERFNLSESDVMDVFDEEKDARQAEMYAAFEQKLSDAVSDGKITEEQKKAILAKHEEIHQRMLDLMDKTPDERRSEMHALRSELETWAEEQGIDLGLLRPDGHKFAHNHMMGYSFRADR